VTFYISNLQILHILDVWGFCSTPEWMFLTAMKKDAWNQLSKRLSVIVCDLISARVCCEALSRAILISTLPFWNRLF
jgi:hypothetical protein